MRHPLVLDAIAMGWPRSRYLFHAGQSGQSPCGYPLPCPALPYGAIKLGSPAPSCTGLAIGQGPRHYPTP